MGSGNDTLADQLAPKGPTVSAVNYDLGACNDTLNLSLLGVPGHNIATNITLGDGGDTLHVSGIISDITVAPTAANFQQGFSTIIDFNPAQDTLNVAAANILQVLSAPQECARLNGSSTLLAALQAAAAFTGGARVVDFEFMGNTYILDDADGSHTFNVGDGVIQLTGVALTSFLNATNFVHA